jgi:hypothetical protein
MLALLIAAAALGGVVLDAVTGRPVHGAVVTDGKNATSVTDAAGGFHLGGLESGTVDVIVQHPSYAIFAQPAVPAGIHVTIRIRPSSIEAEPMEIVETREEDLRPMLLRQQDISFPAEFLWQIRTSLIRGVYRVCMGTDGKVALVATMDSPGSADPYIKEGIAKGWQYKPLRQPTCFYWRVTIKLDPRRGTLRMSPSEQSEPPGPPILPK